MDDFMKNYNKKEIFSQVFPVPILQENEDSDLKPLNTPFTNLKFVHMYSCHQGNQLELFKKNHLKIQNEMMHRKSFQKNVHPKSSSLPQFQCFSNYFKKFNQSKME